MPGDRLILKKASTEPGWPMAASGMCLGNHVFPVFIMEKKKKRMESFG